LFFSCFFKLSVLLKLYLYFHIKPPAVLNPLLVFLPISGLAALTILSLDILVWKEASFIETHSFIKLLSIEYCIAGFYICVFSTKL